MSEVGRRKSEVSPRSESPVKSGGLKSVADLRDRTFEFAVRCIRAAEALPGSRSGSVVSSQLIRCSASVGANYRAARRARSSAEFVAKLGICEEECDEVIYWLQLSKALDLIKPAKLSALEKEADEILSIIVASIKSSRSKKK